MQTKFTVEKTINCPQCGDVLSLYFSYVKIIQCHSCKSTIFLEDDVARLSGESAVLAPEISLIELDKPFLYAQKSYLPLGMIRYSYGRGFWEEWWLKDSDNNAYWLSIDEGDIVLQQQEKTDYSRSFVQSLQLGKFLPGNWMVTEIGTATCEGFTGSLPKNIYKGDSYLYVHLSGLKAQLKTIEVTANGVEVYLGKWISPFDIKEIY